MTDKTNDKPVMIALRDFPQPTGTLTRMPIMDNDEGYLLGLELCPSCNQPESYGCECEDELEGEEDPEEADRQFGADTFERFGY